MYEKAVSLASSLFSGSICGWTNKSELNAHLFVTIQDTKTFDAVRGRVASHSFSNEANWESKFEDMNGDNKSMGIAALTQQEQLNAIFKTEAFNFLAGKTLITKAQSTQVWAGNAPLTLSIEVEFRAFNDAYNEVELPIAKLFKMQSPELHGNIGDALRALQTDKKADANAVKPTALGAVSALGTVPNAIDVSIGNKAFRSLYRLESVSVSEDERKIDKAGNRLEATVSLEFGSYAGLNKSDVKDGSISSVISGIKSLF